MCCQDRFDGDIRMRLPIGIRTIQPMQYLLRGGIMILSIHRSSMATTSTTTTITDTVIIIIIIITQQQY